jgi:hypothetical protein
MKSMIASVLELIVPSSILILLLLSACGGGSSPYGNSKAYDGVWNASIKIAPPGKGDGAVSEVVCALPSLVNLTIANGFGHTVGVTSCANGTASAVGWADYYTPMDVTVTYSAQALSAVIAVDVYPGGRLTGACDSPNACQADGSFYMYR